MLLRGARGSFNNILIGKHLIVDTAILIESDELQLQGVSQHWTPENSQALYKIRHKEKFQVSSSCL